MAAMGLARFNDLKRRKKWRIASTHWHEWFAISWQRTVDAPLHYHCLWFLSTHTDLRVHPRLSLSLAVCVPCAGSTEILGILWWALLCSSVHWSFWMHGTSGYIRKFYLLIIISFYLRSVSWKYTLLSAGGKITQDKHDWRKKPQL